LFLALALAGALISNNVASAVSGKVDTKYHSDAEYRGQAIADDTLSASVTLSQSLDRLSAGLRLETLNALDSGAEMHFIDASLSTDLVADKLSGTIGWLNTDTGTNQSELYVSVTAKTLLSPTLTVYRDTSDELYNYVLGVSTGEIVVEGLPVTFVAGLDVGFIDRTLTTDDTYVEAHVCAKKSLTENADIYAGIEYDDSDLVDDEVGFVLGLSVNF